MSDNTNISGLLATALEGAADIARTRLSREVTTRVHELPDATAILRFDLAFSEGGTLTWYVANEDATGFADMLIGGQGDRAAVLTEMHLDALTVAFSDMLQRTVDVLGTQLSMPLTAGEIDLGMESELPPAQPGETRDVRALDIADFGPFVIMQRADADLTRALQVRAVEPMGAPTEAAPATPAAAASPPAPVHEDAPAPAGPTPVTAAGAPTPASADALAAADNVVALPAHAPAAPAAAAPAGPTGGDLDMLMNVPLPLTVELGSTQRTIRELVDFSIGSIIELGKLAGEPLDIKVNERVIARGEVVVIDEEFGIRVTEIASPEDRVRGLG